MTGAGADDLPISGVGILRIVTNFVLILFTLATGIACVIMLASTLTQARLSTVVIIDGVPVSVWKLDSIREKWALIRHQVVDQTEALSRADKRHVELIDRRSTAAAHVNAAKTGLIQSFQELSAKIQADFPDLAKDLDNDEDVPEKMSKIAAAETSLRAWSGSNLSNLLDYIQITYTGYKSNSQDLMVLETQINGSKERLAKLNGGIKSSQESLKTVIEGIGGKKTDLDDPTRNRIENALYELGSGLITNS